MSSAKPSLILRRATKDMLEELVTISIDGDEEYRKKDWELLQELIAQELIICGFIEESLAWFIYWRPNFLGKKHFWYLHQITVKWRLRNQGLGTLLLEDFLLFAKQNRVSTVFAMIHPDNTPSLAVIQKCGGKHCGNINLSDVDSRNLIRFDL